MLVTLRCRRIASEGSDRLGLGTQQQIECDDVRDHQQGHVDDRDPVHGAQLPRHCRKADLGGVVVVENEIDRSHEIEGDYKQPKEWTYPHREKRQHSQHSGCKVPVGSEGGEASGKISTDDAW